MSFSVSDSWLSRFGAFKRGVYCGSPAADIRMAWMIRPHGSKEDDLFVHG